MGCFKRYITPLAEDISAIQRRGGGTKVKKNIKFVCLERGAIFNFLHGGIVLFWKNPMYVN